MYVTTIVKKSNFNPLCVVMMIKLEFYAHLSTSNSRENCHFELRQGWARILTPPLFRNFGFLRRGVIDKSDFYTRFPLIFASFLTVPLRTIETSITLFWGAI